MLLDRLGPDAPTLCAGWSTADLAAHVVIREHNPLDAMAVVLGDRAGPLRPRAARACARELRRPWNEIVERLRGGPPPGPLAIPGLRESLNLHEFVVHHEDVRRANGLTPREDVPELQDAVWRVVTRWARFAVRGLPRGLGVELARPGGGDHVVPRRGTPTVRATGQPVELMLWIWGRVDDADVQFDGASEADRGAVRAARVPL